MKYLLLFLIVAMLFATTAISQTVVGEKEENEKGKVVEFARFSTKNLNAYLVTPKLDTLNTDVQVGIPIPFFKSLSIGVGVAGVNSFTDRFSFGVWGGDTLAILESFVFKWSAGRCTVNEKGLTTRWFFPINHQKAKAFSLSPQLFWNTVPKKNLFDYGIGAGIEKWGWQILATLWDKQGKWFLVRKMFSK